MSDQDVVIRVENISKLYRLGEVGTGSLAHDVNRWWHRVRGKEDPYLKIGEVNDRTKPAKQSVAGSELLVTSANQSAASPTRNSPPLTSYSAGRRLCTRHQLLATASETPPPLATSDSPPFTVCHNVASLLEVGTGFHPELTGCARSARTTDYRTTGC